MGCLFSLKPPGITRTSNCNILEAETLARRYGVQEAMKLGLQARIAMLETDYGEAKEI